MAGLKQGCKNPNTLTISFFQSPPLTSFAHCLLFSIPSLNTSMTSKRREWRSAVEAKSGKTYYYDAITRETQWRKPLELATQSEREKIEEKDKKLRDFFRSMEMNILKAMDRGQVPGIATTCEDVVKPLRNSTSNTKMKLKKPSLIRTISSMDDTLIEELTQDIEIYNITSSGLISPDNTTTSFFESLPQPSQKNPSTSQYSPPPFATSSDLDSAPTCFKSKITPPASEVSKHLPKPTMAKRNTCGSLYIRNTMADPDKDACIKVSLEFRMIDFLSNLFNFLTTTYLFSTSQGFMWSVPNAHSAIHKRIHCTAQV